MGSQSECREWRESLGAYVLGQLDVEERAGVEAHLDGCSECRAEVASLTPVARMLPHADPARFGPAPQPPPELGARIAAAIEGERRQARSRHRLRLGFGLGTATAAAALLILLLAPRGGNGPEQHVAFAALPAGVKINATLEPHAYGTEIHMYVRGIRSGTLCRVYLRGPHGTEFPAGTFRYRWGEDSDAVLSSALDLSRTRAIAVRAGKQTFVARVGAAPSAAIDNDSEEEQT
jgi:hypothetical protein